MQQAGRQESERVRESARGLGFVVRQPTRAEIPDLHSPLSRSRVVVSFE